MQKIELRCSKCGSAFSQNDPIIVCVKCGNPLDIVYDYDEIRERMSRKEIGHRPTSVWSYKELLPTIKEERIVSMGEGGTPLTATERYGRSLRIPRLFVKLDYLNPSGSFKDRGTTVSVSKLRELKIASVIDDSSGNAASSLAAYCAKAGVRCRLYVPAHAPQEKLIQAEMYGAHMTRISGSRTDVAKAAQSAWKSTGTYYASHNLSPFFFEGMKTVAYEIAVDAGWDVPDHIVFPVGGGALIAGAWKGFEELRKMDWINRMPKLHCVQSESCKPIVDAFERGGHEIVPAAERETVAGGVRISNPVRGREVLEALRRTNGHAVSVADDAILREQLRIARDEGIFVEPTSCVALAGLQILDAGGAFDKDEFVVVELTGCGLKDMNSASLSLSR
jgi:threonine synthase